MVSLKLEATVTKSVHPHPHPYVRGAQISCAGLFRSLTVTARISAQEIRAVTVREPEKSISCAGNPSCGT